MTKHEMILIALIVIWLIAEWYILNRACDKREGLRP